MPRAAVLRISFASASILGLLQQRALAQRPDSAYAAAARLAPARSPREAKREAELRRRKVDYIEGAAIPSGPGFLRGRPLAGKTLLTSSDERTTYLEVARAASSRPEVHARWDDLVMIRSGAGAIVLGDSLVGSTYRAPGEREGGTFHRSWQIVVHAGDIVRIPAAVPHAFVVSGTEPLEYLVVKIRRQDLPIRWFRAR